MSLLLFPRMQSFLAFLKCHVRLFHPVPRTFALFSVQGRDVASHVRQTEVTCYTVKSDKVILLNKHTGNHYFKCTAFFF